MLERAMGLIAELLSRMSGHAHTGADGSSQITGSAVGAWAGTGDIADVAATEGAGTGTALPRGDHVHAIPSGLITNDMVNASAAIAASKITLGLFSVLDYGAVGDAKSVATGAITATTATLTAVGAGFVAGDVGKTIVVYGAGAAGARLITTISAYTSGTQVTLADNAATTVGGAAQVTWGTNDTTAISNAMTAASGKTLLFPNGNYLVSNRFTIPSNTTLRGDTGAEVWADAIATALDTFIVLGSNVSGSEGHDILIENLTIRNSQQYAIQIYGSGYTYPPYSVRVQLVKTSVPTAGTNSGMYVNVGHDIEFFGCTNDNGNLHISFRGTSLTSNDCYNIRVESCATRGTLGFGYQAVWAYNVDISHCTVDGSSMSAGSGRDLSGITVDRCFKFAVEGNTIQGAPNEGIYVTGSLYGNVTGNQVSGRPPGGTQGNYGIQVTGNFEGILDPTRYESAYVSVDGNSVFDVAITGIVVNGARYVTVSGNAIAGTTTADVAVQDTTRTVSAANGAITNGAAILTCASAAFTSEDVGRAITVTGAGVAGATLSTTVLSYQSATQVTLSINASTTVTTATITIALTTTNWAVIGNVGAGVLLTSGVAANGTVGGNQFATYTGQAILRLQNSSSGGLDFSNSVFIYRNSSTGVLTLTGAPMLFNNEITVNGAAILSSAALATNATTGFTYIPTCAGRPTGAPSAKTGTVPIVFDTTNGRLWVYQAAAWKLMVGANTPSARAYHDTTQSINNATLTAVALNQERYDTDTFHDLSTNNSRMTVPTGLGGLYHITGCVEFASNAAGDRRVHLRVDGATYIAVETVVANTVDRTSLQVSADYILAAGSYVEMIVYQASGGALNLESNANRSPELSLVLLATP